MDMYNPLTSQADYKNNLFIRLIYVLYKISIECEILLL